MTTHRESELADPLTVLESVLLDRARRDADAALAAADMEADAVRRKAHAEADAMLDDARAKGAADGAAVLSRARSRAELEARSVLLASQQAAYDRVRLAARDAVAELRHHPVYPALLDALRVRARRDLGPTAVATELPGGGLVAEVDGRRIEYSLAELADDVMDRMADEVDRLWTP